MMLFEKLIRLTLESYEICHTLAKEHSYGT